MRQLSLGFKAYDIHELACHSVAEYAGLYSGVGLSVRLEDTRAAPAASSREPDYSVACGAAAIRWLRGEDLKVLFVATARPMFWLVGEIGGGIRELHGRRIATYPEPSPPAHFLRIILREAGLEPGDVDLAPAPDDAARLRMLRSGSASAALLSSATWPGSSAASGLREIICLGDGIRLPTTGLVASRATLEQDGETATMLQNCLRASLRIIHTDDGTLRRALHGMKLVDGLDADRVIHLIRSRFTADGLVDPEEVHPGLQRLAHSLQAAAPRDPAELYGQVMRK
jgi:ABC-type nitrate/sulfonate/bicarbonate transport system substrate-binding protein